MATTKTTKKATATANPKTANSTYDPNDFTNQAQAMNQADVDAQDSRTRLWQSLNYSYNKQRDESNKSFDKALSDTDRQALARGMGRSSYNNQVMANLRTDKANAQNDIYAAQIADYQNRIGELEQQEKENEWREREFNENVRQHDEEMGFKKSEADRAQANADRDYEANRADAAWEQQFQQGEAERQQGNVDREYEANRADTEWKQNQQEIEFAFAQKQWEAQQAQWREEFDYNQKTNDQKIAFEAVLTAASNRGDVSDDLLARAGLTRKDFDAMKSKASGGYAKPKGTTDDDEETSSDTGRPGVTDQDIRNLMGGDTSNRNNAAGFFGSNNAITTTNSNKTNAENTKNRNKFSKVL